ncbi:MAG: TonB family protein [Gemmatimonadetes bacterium]|nr:TonB family protein [Gemmatimonadota bacterium]
MLKTLPESSPLHVRRAGGTVTSMMIHGVLIASAVALAVPADGRATVKPAPPPTLTYLKTQPDPTPAPLTTNSGLVVEKSATRIQVPLGHIDHIPPIGIGSTQPAEIVMGNLPPENMFYGRGVGETGVRLAGPPAGNVVDVKYVERAPFVIGTPAAPRYPAALRANGMSGSVVVRFVVDTAGRAEMTTVEITESSHSLFTDAVREALARYRFSAGEMSGHKVRTMVQLPFTFEVH